LTQNRFLSSVNLTLLAGGIFMTLEYSKKLHIADKVLDVVVNNLLDYLGISKEQVDKLAHVIDNIEVNNEGTETFVDIKIKRIRITLEK